MSDASRIESLETQVRALKQMLFGVLALVVVGGLVAATTLQNVPDVIQAKKFELVSAKGNVVGEFHVDEHGGGSFSLHNNDGNEVIGMNAKKNGRGFLGIHDQHGKPRVRMYSDSVGAKVQLMNNRDGQLIAMGGNMESNGSMWFFRKSDEMPLCTILSSADGSGKVATYGTDGVTDSLPSSTEPKKAVDK